MLWRKDSKEIRNWVNTSDKTALLVTGARQTGKTTLIRNILEEEGVHFHEINFVEQTEIIDFATTKGFFLFYLYSSTYFKQNHRERRCHIL